MDKRIGLFFFGATCFLLFVFFSYLVVKDVFLQFDFDTTVRLQYKVTEDLSIFFSYFSLLGSAEVITPIFLLVILFWPLRFWRKLTLIPAYFLVMFLGFLGKMFITHPGPPFMFYHYKLGFVFPSTYVQTGNSYPSGHSARTIFLSLILMMFIFKSQKPMSLKLFLIGIILAYDAIMLISRVYLGEHWITDVIGGAFLGASLAFFGGMFLKLR